MVAKNAIERGGAVPVADIAVRFASNAVIQRCLLGFTSALHRHSIPWLRTSATADGLALVQFNLRLCRYALNFPRVTHIVQSKLRVYLGSSLAVALW